MLELIFLETFGGTIAHPFLKLAAEDCGRQDDAALVLGGLVRPPRECHGHVFEPFEVGERRVRFVSLAWLFVAHEAMVPPGIAGSSARRGRVSVCSGDNHEACPSGDPVEELGRVIVGYEELGFRMRPVASMPAV